VPDSLWHQYRLAVLTNVAVILFLLSCVVVLLRLRYQLKASRKQYLELVEHANSVILRMDRFGHVQFINAFGEKLLGYSIAELRGKHVVGSIVPEVDVEGRNMGDFIAKLLASPDLYQECENENVAKDGRRIWIRWFNRPLFNKQGELEALFSVGSDVTEKKLRDEDIVRFNRKVAHDLRSPLVTINSFANMLRDDIESGDRESVEQDVKYIVHAANKMGQQVDELSHLFRIGASHQVAARFSIAEAVEEARMVVAGRLREHDVVVNINVQGWIVGDRAHFVDIMQNLLDNAAKHMGTQTVPVIEVGAGLREDRPAMYVRDNGEGIDPDKLEKIFEPFVKLDNRSEGTGLGLSLVRHIVEKQGGRIWAESEGLGRGTTFWLVLNNTELENAHSI